MVIDLEKERYRRALEYIANCPDEAIGHASAAEDMRNRAEESLHSPSPVASQELEQ